MQRPQHDHEEWLLQQGEHGTDERLQAGQCPEVAGREPAGSPALGPSHPTPTLSLPWLLTGPSPDLGISGVGPVGAVHAHHQPSERLRQDSPKHEWQLSKTLPQIHKILGKGWKYK